MKKTITTISSLLLISLMIFSQGFGQSTDKRGAARSKVTAPASKSNPGAKRTSANKPDGMIYKRIINNAAARRTVRTNLGFKSTKPYIGQTTENRSVKRKYEHAKTLGLSKEDLNMKIVNRRIPRKDLRVAEQNAIRKGGGVEKLANKRNAVSSQNWKIRQNKMRQARLRRSRGH